MAFDDYSYTKYQNAADAIALRRAAEETERQRIAAKAAAEEQQARTRIAQEAENQKNVERIQAITERQQYANPYDEKFFEENYTEPFNRETFERDVLPGLAAMERDRYYRDLQEQQNIASGGTTPPSPTPVTPNPEEEMGPPSPPVIPEQPSSPPVVEGGSGGDTNTTSQPVVPPSETPNQNNPTITSPTPSNPDPGTVPGAQNPGQTGVGTDNTPVEFGQVGDITKQLTELKDKVDEVTKQAIDKIIQGLKDDPNTQLFFDAIKEAYDLLKLNNNGSMVEDEGYWSANPLDLRNKNIFAQNSKHWILLQAFNNKSIRLSEGIDITKARPFFVGGIVLSFLLPSTDSTTNNISVAYQESELGTLGGMGGKIMSRLGNGERGMGTILGDSSKEIVNLMSDSAVSSFLSGLSGKMGMSGAQADVAPIVTGRVVNPFSFTVFKGVSHRQFSIAVDLVPTSREMAANIELAMKRMVKAMMPATQGASNVFLTVPAVWKVDFMFENQINKKIQPFDYAFLRTAGMTPSKVLHEDGFPAKLSLSLDFIEVLPMNRVRMQAIGAIDAG